jgi:TfoX/Sxy family transcriptional regulator of competence genes
MFGEYALYCDDKVVALICDNRLFVKPTADGAVYVGNAEKAQAYPGSSLFFVVEEERWDDRDWMSELFRITAAALPAPKMKKSKKKK